MGRKRAIEHNSIDTRTVSFSKLVQLIQEKKNISLRLSSHGIHRLQILNGSTLQINNKQIPMYKQFNNEISDLQQEIQTLPEGTIYATLSTKDYKTLSNKQEQFSGIPLIEDRQQALLSQEHENRLYIPVHIFKSTGLINTIVYNTYQHKYSLLALPLIFYNEVMGDTKTTLTGQTILDYTLGVDFEYPMDNYFDTYIDSTGNLITAQARLSEGAKDSFFSLKGVKRLYRAEIVNLQVFQQNKEAKLHLIDTHHLNNTNLAYLMLLNSKDTSLKVTIDLTDRGNSLEELFYNAQSKGFTYIYRILITEEQFRTNKELLAKLNIGEIYQHSLTVRDDT